MKRIALAQEPSQKFPVKLAEHNFDLTVRDVGGICLMDIAVDGNTLALSLPVFPNQPVIPYKHLARFGNFVFISSAEDYPTWEELGKSVALFYITPEEAQEAANG